jgi:hypothetical protein
MSYQQQDLFEAAYNLGLTHRMQGKEAQPLLTLLWLANYVSYGSEAECQAIIAQYQAGYAGYSPVSRR